ncbi:MAG: hypothetical protein KF758_19070 [Anaerolineales bacterium]|nr:hypothetical protein [Anaerolineales bacterium]
MTNLTQLSNYSTHMPHSSGKPVSVRGYHAFLLRVWCEDENSTWRVQVDNPHTSETFFFSSIENLFAFLDVIISKEKEGK